MRTTLEVTTGKFASQCSIKAQIGFITADVPLNTTVQTNIVQNVDESANFKDIIHYRNLAKTNRQPWAMIRRALGRWNGQYWLPKRRCRQRKSPERKWSHRYVGFMYTIMTSFIIWYASTWTVVVELGEFNQKFCHKQQHRMLYAFHAELMPICNGGITSASPVHFWRASRAGVTPCIS